MKLPDNVIRSYNSSRSGTDRSLVCHAPSVNLNFEQNGNVRACCYNTTHILGTWPAQTIRDIWQGAAAMQLREYIADRDLGGGCTECGHMILSGNYQGVRAHYYDEYAPDGIIAAATKRYKTLTRQPSYPRVMEFELSNECNLECIMCNGYFSSSIRKNREKLPPVRSVYDDRFVNQLEEFIPHLTDAKFLGGEPFMIDIYLKIWERIRKIKPNIRIHITTNATFLNRRIKDLLEGLHAGIILSIDSVNPETYRKIRVNGSYEKVMENLEYFREYTRRKKTFLSLAACPITHNWHELPELLEFCIEKEIALYFNAVFSPSEFSLKDQAVSYQQEVIDRLEAYKLPTIYGRDKSPAQLSIKAYTDFIKLLKGWLEEKKATENGASNTPSYAGEDVSFTKENITWSLDEVKATLADLAKVSDIIYVDKEVQLLNHIANLFVSIPADRLSEVVLYYFDYIPDSMPTDRDVMAPKAEAIAQMINAHAQRERILLMMSRARPADLGLSFYHATAADLAAQLSAAFG